MYFKYSYLSYKQWMRKYYILGFCFKYSITLIHVLIVMFWLLRVFQEMSNLSLHRLRQIGRATWFMCRAYIVMILSVFRICYWMFQFLLTYNMVRYDTALEMKTANPKINPGASKDLMKVTRKDARRDTFSIRDWTISLEVSFIVFMGQVWINWLYYNYNNRTLD